MRTIDIIIVFLLFGIIIIAMNLFYRHSSNTQHNSKSNKKSNHY